MPLLYLFIGALIGAAILYFIQRADKKALETKLRQTRRELERTEADFQSQMQQTIAYLRKEYDRESTQKNEETIQQYQKEIRALKHEHHLQIEKLQGKSHQQQDNYLSERPTDRPVLPLSSHFDEEREFPFEAFNDSFLEAENALNETEIEIPIAAPPIQELPDFIAEEPSIIADSLDLGLDSSNEENNFLDELASFLSERPRITFDPSSDRSRSQTETSLSQPLQDEYPSSSPPSDFPNTQKDKIVKILSLGTVDRIPQLNEYIYDRDPQIRAAVAETIGNIAVSANIQSKIGQCLSILDKLIRDNNVSVRRETAITLGKIRSEKVIPLIRLALKDNDSEVVRLSSVAIGRFRVYPNSTLPVKKSSSTKKQSS
jgi:gas vesicle protein